MIRLLLTLALAVFGLNACRDDGLSKPIHSSTANSGATPTPTPGVTPTPTPNPNDPNDPNDPDNPDDPGDTNGAPMTSANESISVVSIDSPDVTESTLTIARSNGEVWEFDVPGIPAVTVGATLTYRNSALVFGEVSGDLVFADGTTSQISNSGQIQ